tara:strand:- start:333 stop:674 length:342 start_codon:yes stop_codon:yes gene_type:complete
MLDKFRTTIIVDSKLREKIYSRMRVEEVTQTETLRLNDLSEDDLRTNFTYVEKIVSQGDKMYKFAHEIYDNADYWWIIAWFNNKPTDAHCKIGEVLYIPLPLDRAISVATREK